jgi:hypothetical protein
MSGDRVQRTKIIDGLATPAFIHNGGYHLINLPVFADGLVDCWEMVDLPLFREKARAGWVGPRVPDGEVLSVHGLGSWTVAGGQWDLDAAGFIDRVMSLLRELNPRMENLQDYHARAEVTVRGDRLAIIDMAGEQPYREVDPGADFPARITGDRLWVLVRSTDYYIASLRVFKDGVCELTHLPSPATLSLDDLRRAVGEGHLVGTIPPGARVGLHGLGSFVAAEEHHCTNPAEMLREVDDLLATINSRPDTLALCRAAHAAYLADPCVALRDALREAYEAVPAHKRRYVGDMDTKDVAVRMIIYGDQELEGWSHRAAGRALGLETLPSFRVPKPRDE